MKEPQEVLHDDAQKSRKDRLHEWQAVRRQPTFHLRALHVTTFDLLAEAGSTANSRRQG
jgi:hypothetical protein